MTGALRISHVVTGTPLAREHQLLLDGRSPRGAVKIPWSRFDRSQYPTAALDASYQLHLRLAAGEYLAVDTFSRVTSALSQVGAPLDLIAAAARVVTDEIRHADYALTMAARLSGQPLEAVFTRVSAADLAERERAYTGRLKSLEELDMWMAEVPAYGETLACGLLLACGRGATDPVIKALYRAIVGDEVRHARLGWYWLAWRSPTWSRAHRQRIANRVGELVQSAPQQFGRGVDLPRGNRRAARALAVLDTPAQRAALNRVMTDEILPGFEALGFAVTRAWKGVGTIASRLSAS